MGIDLHRIGDDLELDCSFGHYQEAGTLLHWAYECGAFAPPAFKSMEDLYEKQDFLIRELADQLHVDLDSLVYGTEEHRRFFDVFFERTMIHFRVSGDPRPSISTFSGSTGYRVSPKETQEMLKRLPKNHEKYQHFIDFLEKCSETGFTID